MPDNLAPRTKWEVDYARAIVEKALSAATADAVTVRFVAREDGATRFALSEITQNVVRHDAAVQVKAAYDNRVGTASTNRLDDEAIADCVCRAEAIARVAPPDPEYMPPVEPAAAPSLDLWQDSTRSASPAERAEAVQRIVTAADREGLTASGAIATSVISVAVGNSSGQFLQQAETLAALTCSATGPDSVGWAQGASRDFASLDVDGVAARAVEKACAGRNPRDASPGRYDVILEPAAVDTFLAFFFHYQMDARATDEGRTFLTGKKGTSLVSPRVRLYSDPGSPDCPARPFTGEGLPLERTDWIQDGVLSNLVYSRFWAREKGVEPTGFPTNLILAGSDSGVEDLIRSTARGLLVTRFWYVRAVEPVRDLFTGMTRDGTFLIENGEIAGPVRNLRFNESPVHFLSEVEAFGPQEIVSERGSWRLMPYVKSRNFHFTSTTRF